MVGGQLENFLSDEGEPNDGVDREIPALSQHHPTKQAPTAAVTGARVNRDFPRTGVAKSINRPGEWRSPRENLSGVDGARTRNLRRDPAGSVQAKISLRRLAAGFGEALDMPKYRGVHLAQTRWLGRPVVHLEIDVDRVVAIPRSLVPIGPKPLQIGGHRTVRTAARDEQIAAPYWKKSATSAGSGPL